MQNKIIFLFFVISFFCKALAEDQFTFDVSKIEILENGNKIIGSERGLIVSNSGINIEADNFEYSKKDSTLKVNGNVIINYPEKNYEIFAEKITYIKDKEIISAKNNIKFIDSKEKILTSDNFLFNIKNNLFTFTDRVKIIDRTKNYSVNSEKIIYFKNDEKILGQGLTKILYDENYSFESKKELKIDLRNNIISASKDVKYIDLLKKYKFLSDEIIFFRNEEKIITKGKTSAFINDKFIINSKDINFSRKKEIIKSNKKASINDIKNDSYYEIKNYNLSLDNEILKGENISINTDYSKPLNDKYYIKSGIFDLKNKSFVTQDININLKKDIFNNEKNDPRLKGISSSSKDGITIINKGIFTSCSKENKDCPPWSLQAEKIKYDENSKLITYDNALLKVYDKPVFYFPKFFHPGPTVKRQSGFLAPRLGNSKILGSSIQVPYFWAADQNKDFTLTPTIYDKNIIKIQNEYRLEQKNSSLIADLSFTEGYRSKTNKDKNSITHFCSKYRHNLELDNFTDSTLDISLQKINNDTYLKIFDQNATSEKLKPLSDDLLTSEIKLNLKNDKYKLVSGATSYENLNKNKSDRYEFILPYYTLSGELNDGSEYGYLNFSSSGSNVLKDTNNLRSRVINDFDFKGLDIITNSGIQNNINIHVKNLLKSGKKDSEYSSSVKADLLGIVELSSALPLIKGDENFI